MKVFKIIIVLAIILLELYSLLDNIGLFEKKLKFGFFGYYTNLSNILVMFYFIMVLINIFTDNLAFVNNIRISISVTLCITMTFLIYHFILSPDIVKKHKEGTLDWDAFALTNIALHYICPILTIVYWFVCTDGGSIKAIDGLYWLILPFIYIIYILIRVALNIKITEEGDRYPYDFMNVDKFGWKVVIRNIIVLMIIFGLLGMLVAFLKSLL